MTFEEAKKIFLNRGYIEVSGGTYYDADKWREAITVISKWLEQEPCDDCISRQAVHDVLKKHWLSGTVAHRVIDEIGLSINALPPVIPKEKTGHWFVDERPESDREVICSNCEQPVFLYHKLEFDYRPKYCPNCGARMEQNNLIQGRRAGIFEFVLNEEERTLSSEDIKIIHSVSDEVKNDANCGRKMVSE